MSQPDPDVPTVPMTTMGKLGGEPAVIRAVKRVSPVNRTRRRSEADIQKGCVQLLNGRGYAIVTTGSRYLPTGTPDVLACVRGRMVAVEIKRPGERPEPAQVAQLRRWQNAGALAGWACSEEQLEQLLRHVEEPLWRNDFQLPGDGSR